MVQNRPASGRSFNLDEVNAETVDASNFLKDGEPLALDFLDGQQVFVVEDVSDLTGLEAAREEDVAFVEKNTSSEDPEIYILQTDNYDVQEDWNSFDLSAELEGAVNTVSILNDNSQLAGVSEPTEADIAIVESSDDADGASLAYVYTGLNWVPIDSPVKSVFGRTGDVTAQTGDYSFDQISGQAADSQIPSSTVIQHQDDLSLSEDQMEDLYESSTRFFVDSEGGDDSNNGKSWRNAFATLDAAVQAVVDRRAEEEGTDNRFVVPGSPQTQFTIKVAAGDYYVDNPITLPDNTAIMGDELRNTRVFPQNPRADILHLNSLDFVWGLRFKDHKAPSFAFAFPSANAQATISNGEVSNIELLYSPSGYEEAPPVVIDKPRDPDGTQAQAEAVMTDGKVTGFNITDPGSGYDGTAEELRVSVPAPEYMQPWVTGSPYPLNCSSITGPFDVNGNEIPPTLPLPYDTSEPGTDPITGQTFSDPVDIQGAGGGLIIDGHVCYGWNDMTEPQDDTDLPRSPLRSFVAANYTQVNQGGPGFEIINEGFAQFVSCFSTFCTHGYKAKGGGFALISNSVSDFGNTGLTSQNYYEEPYNSGDIVNDEFSSVAEVNVNNPGSGYSDPTATLSGGNPSTAATISITEEGGEITDVTVASSGAGYQSTPSVVITDSDRDASSNTDATFSVVLNEVGEIIVNNLDTFFQPGADQQTRNPEQGTIFFLDGVEREITTWEETASGDYRLSFFPSITSVSSGKTIEMYNRSTINSGGHVFEYPGTGVTYNALPEYGGITDLAQQTVEFGAGRVFHTSSDNEGNFYVGESFQVDQQTGEVTIDTDQFNLSGLNAIGPFRVDGVIRGVQLNEVSNRSDLQSNSGLNGNTVPTVSAVRDFFLDSNRTIPDGGGDGQVLTKLSSGDRDVNWEYISYNDLVDVPSEFEPASHGNEAHSTDFAESGHGNEAHSSAFITDVGIQDFGIGQGDADTINFRDGLQVESVENGVATVNENIDITGSNNINAGQNSIVLEAGEGITLARFNVPSDRVVQVLGGFIADKDGNSVAGGTELELFNHTEGTTEYVIDSSDYQIDESGFYNGSSGDQIEVRMVNATNSQKVLTGTMMINVADQADV